MEYKWYNSARRCDWCVEYIWFYFHFCLNKYQENLLKIYLKSSIILSLTVKEDYICSQKIRVFNSLIQIPKTILDYVSVLCVFSANALLYTNFNENFVQNDMVYYCYQSLQIPQYFFSSYSQECLHNIRFFCLKYIYICAACYLP